MSNLVEIVSNALNGIGLSNADKIRIRSYVVDNAKKYKLEEGCDYLIEVKGDHNDLTIYPDDLPEEFLLELYNIVCPD